MWAWKKRLFSTPQSSPSTLEQAFLSQQKLIEQITRKQQATIDALTATVDKVVTAHYDRPIERHVAPNVESATLSGWALNDGPTLSEVLNSESDKEFLKAVGADGE